MIQEIYWIAILDLPILRLDRKVREKLRWRVIVSLQTPKLVCETGSDALRWCYSQSCRIYTLPEIPYFQTQRSKILLFTFVDQPLLTTEETHLIQYAKIQKELFII
ncbi:hypothetical protein ACOME3_000063 [Neoechinorhynchus agilis]